MVNGLLKKRAPLFASTWAGKTGLDDPQAAFTTTLEWANSVKVDLDAARQYAQAVYANTDAYLATLKLEDLDRSIDLTAQGMGVWTLGAFLLTFLFGHIRDIMGEVSALKGLKGLQGYPF